MCLCLCFNRIIYEKESQQSSLQSTKTHTHIVIYRILSSKEVLGSWELKSTMSNNNNNTNTREFRLSEREREKRRKRLLIDYRVALRVSGVIDCGN